MSGLRTVDPAGRVDVLAYRLSESLGQRMCPREWPIVAPHVEQWTRQNLPSGRLGVAPLVLGAGLVAAGAAGQFIESSIASWMDRYTPAPKSPPAPAAPKTKEEMSVPGAWTPEKLAAADLANWNRWRVNPFPDLPETEDKLWIWIAVGASVVGLILLTRK